MVSKIRKMIIRNKFLQLLDRESRKHLNCVRFSKDETPEHILSKTIFCISAKNNGLDYITEVYSKDRKRRADIILFTDVNALVVEIIESEKPESIEAKRKYWMSKGFDFKAEKTIEVFKK